MPDFLHRVHPVQPHGFCSACKVKCARKYGKIDAYSSDHMMGKKQKMLYYNDVKSWGLVFSVIGRQELKHIKPSPNSFTIKLVSSLGNTKQLLSQYSQNLHQGKNKVVSPFCFTKYPGTAVYLQYKLSSDFQAAAVFLPIAASIILKTFKCDL